MLFITPDSLFSTIILSIFGDVLILFGFASSLLFSLEATALRMKVYGLSFNKQFFPLGNCLFFNCQFLELAGKSFCDKSFYQQVLLIGLENFKLNLAKEVRI